MYGASARFRAMASPISFLQPSVSFAAAFHTRVYSKSTASKQHPPISFWSFPRASSSLPSRLLPPSTPASTANLRLQNSTLSSPSGLSHVPSSSGTSPFLGVIRKSTILITWLAYYTLYRSQNVESITSLIDR